MPTRVETKILRKLKQFLKRIDSNQRTPPHGKIPIIETKCLNNACECVKSSLPGVPKNVH